MGNNVEKTAVLRECCYPKINVVLLLHSSKDKLLIIFENECCAMACRGLWRSFFDMVMVMKCECFMFLIRLLLVWIYNIILLLKVTGKLLKNLLKELE